MLPVVATVIAFFRHIIGIRGFGIYTSLILSFAFVEAGLEYGLIIFFLVLLAGTLARILISKLHLAYLPRMASVLIFCNNLQSWVYILLLVTYTLQRRHFLGFQ